MLINLARMVGRDSNRLIETLNGGLRDVLKVSGCEADESLTVFG